MEAVCAYCKKPSNQLNKLSERQDIRSEFKNLQEEDKICKKCCKKAIILQRMRNGEMPLKKKKRIELDCLTKEEKNKKPQSDNSISTPNRREEKKRESFSQPSFPIFPLSSITNGGSNKQSLNNKTAQDNFLENNEKPRLDISNSSHNAVGEKIRESFSQPSLSVFPQSNLTQNNGIILQSPNKKAAIDKQENQIYKREGSCLENKNKNKKSRLDISISAPNTAEEKNRESFSQPSLYVFPHSNVTQNNASDRCISQSLSSPQTSPQKIRESFSQPSLSVFPQSNLTQNNGIILQSPNKKAAIDKQENQIYKREGSCLENKNKNKKSRLDISISAPNTAEEKNRESFSQPSLYVFPHSNVTQNNTSDRCISQSLSSPQTFSEKSYVLSQLDDSNSMAQLKNHQDQDKPICKNESLAENNVHVEEKSVSRGSSTLSSLKNTNTTSSMKVNNSSLEKEAHTYFTSLNQDNFSKSSSVVSTFLVSKSIVTEKADLTINTSGDLFAESCDKLKQVNNKQIISISPEYYENDKQIISIDDDSNDDNNSSQCGIFGQESVILNTSIHGNKESQVCPKFNIISQYTDEESVSQPTDLNIETAECSEKSNETIHSQENICRYCKLPNKKLCKLGELPEIRLAFKTLQDNDSICGTCITKARMYMTESEEEEIESNVDVQVNNLQSNDIRPNIKPCSVLVTPLPANVMHKLLNPSTKSGQINKPRKDLETDVINSLLTELQDLIKRPRRNKRKISTLRTKITNIMVHRKKMYLMKRSDMPYTITEATQRTNDLHIDEPVCETLCGGNVNNEVHIDNVEIEKPSKNNSNEKEYIENGESCVIECDESQSRIVDTQNSIICDDTQENIGVIRDCSQNSVQSDDMILPSYDTVTCITNLTRAHVNTKLDDGSVEILNSETEKSRLDNFSNQDHMHLLENDSECFHFSNLSRLVNNLEKETVSSSYNLTTEQNNSAEVLNIPELPQFYLGTEIPFGEEIEISHTDYYLENVGESSKENQVDIIDKTNDLNRKSLKRLQSEDYNFENNHTGNKKKKIDDAEILIDDAVKLTAGINEPMPAIASPSITNKTKKDLELYKKPLKMLCKQSKNDPLHVTNIGQLIDINIHKMKWVVYCKNQDEMGNYHQIFKNEQSLADPVCTVSNCNYTEPYFKFTSFLTVGSSELELNGFQAHRNLIGLPPDYCKIVLNLLYSVGNFYFYRQKDHFPERPLQIQFLQLLAETIPRFQPSTILFQNVSNEKSTRKHAYLRGIESSKNRVPDVQNASCSILEKGLKSKTKQFLLRGSEVRERTLQIKRNIRICRNEQLDLLKTGQKPCEESAEKENIEEKLAAIELKITDLQDKLKKISVAEINYRKDIKQYINI